MPSCIIRSCPYRTGIKTLHPDIILHVFPKDKHRIKLWLERTGHVFKDIDAFAERVFETKKNDNYRLCSAHFTGDCYVHAGRTKVLKVDAVPSIFPPGDKLIEETFRQRASRKTRMNRILNSLNASKLCVDGSPNINVISIIKNPSTVRMDVGTQTEIYRSTCHQGVQVPEFAFQETGTVQEDFVYDSTNHLMQQAVTSSEICLQVPEFRTNYLPDSLMVQKSRSHMTESILHLTLEILYLVTGEDYTAPKMMSGDFVRRTFCPHVSGGLSRTQNFITEPPPHSLVDRNNEQKILELTNKIIQLLTGEVPIRRQDVTVYLSMEEWEYLERHKDLYKDIMMENHQPLTSADLSKYTAPHSSSTHIKEEPVSCDGENLSAHMTPTYHTPYTYTHIKEESVSCNGENLTDIFTPTGHTQYTPTHIKEESVSCDGGTLTHTDIYTPTYHTQYTSTHSKEESVSCDGGTLTHTDMYTPTYHTQYTSSHSKEESVSCDGGTLTHTDTSVHTETSTLKDHMMDEADCTAETNVISTVTSTKEMPVSSNCQKWFIGNSGFPNQEGVQMLNQYFVCSECSVAFSVRSQFVIHQRTHTGEKPLSRSEYDECFGAKSNLVKNPTTHAGENPYSCMECGKWFTQKYNLSRHQRTHKGDNQYPCTECGECFTKKSHLNRHQRTHTGEKPYCCTECGKCFTKRSYLFGHHRTHSAETPLFCSECDKGFVSKSDLAKHRIIHIRAKPHPLIQS